MTRVKQVRKKAITEDAKHLLVIKDVADTQRAMKRAILGDFFPVQSSYAVVVSGWLFVVRPCCF